MMTGVERDIYIRVLVWGDIVSYSVAFDIEYCSSVDQCEPSLVIPN